MKKNIESTSNYLGWFIKNNLVTGDWLKQLKSLLKSKQHPQNSIDLFYIHSLPFQSIITNTSAKLITNTNTNNNYTSIPGNNSLRSNISNYSKLYSKFYYPFNNKTHLIMGIRSSKNKDGCACICQHCLPYRTSAFNGHPFYSCSSPFQLQKRWFISSSKMNDLHLRGLQVLKDNQINKDLAFTMRERDILGLKGLLPPAIRDANTQCQVFMELLRSLSNLEQYILLRVLQDDNERLFYRLLGQYTEELMPIVYTPTVGQACMNYSKLYRPRGMWITIHDAGNIDTILANWPYRDVKAIVVTDGERILGLGDLGSNGMGIPVGKLALYTALAGIPPYLTLPITIDVGTNNERLLNDNLYIGLKHKRMRGHQYDDLIDEFMEAVVKRWGRSCLIQFEDFGNSNAFRLLEKYKDHYCTFNDDIQGTASVCVAGILASHRITGMRTSQHTFLFFGAGEAALGTADLLVMEMEQEGLTKQEAQSHIWLMDSKGLCVHNRPEGCIDKHKAQYAKNIEPYKNLIDIIDVVQPTALIGVAAQHNAFTEEVLTKMANINKRPLIFPLSNPTSKAECTAEAAYKYTEGRCIFASGSPFDSVSIDGKIFHPGQGNNAYIFPGVSLAVIACGVHFIPNETFLVAAKALADQVTKENLEEGRIYPPLSNIHDVSLAIASKVSQYFYVESFATVRPEPEDKILFLRAKQYDYSYEGDSLINHMYPKKNGYAL